MSAKTPMMRSETAKIINVFVTGLMTPSKPTTADNNDGNGVSHHAKNKEQRICQPRTGHPT